MGLWLYSASVTLSLILLSVLLSSLSLLLFHKTWKYAFRILIYNKGDKKVASNFRPITMQLVFTKVYSSLIRNRIYKFPLESNYIESQTQKRFSSDISRSTAYWIINLYNKHAGKKRQALITLLELQNAFGKVDHHWLLKVLDCHYVPVELKSLIKNYYLNCAISTRTGNYSTEPILVRKGVLQGDCLSLLIFNMVKNTLINTIDGEKVKCMRCNYCDIMSPRHW